MRRRASIAASRLLDRHLAPAFARRRSPRRFPPGGRCRRASRTSPSARRRRRASRPAPRCRRRGARRNASAAPPPAPGRRARPCSAARPRPPRAPRGCRRPGTALGNDGDGFALARWPASPRVTTATTCGMTSPARWMTTVSPIADVLARDLVLVVQRRVRDHDAADGDRLELGDGRQRAGAADLDRRSPFSIVVRLLAPRTCARSPSAARG